MVHAARALGFRIQRLDEVGSERIGTLHLPCLVILQRPAAEDNPKPDGNEPEATPEDVFYPAIIVQIGTEGVTLFEAGTNTPVTLTVDQFANRYMGTAFQLALNPKDLQDPDSATARQSAFGFRWFVPELLKHKHVWRDVLIASLIIQLLALGTPLFTQVVIDKVVVHRTQRSLAGYRIPSSE